MSPAEDLRAAAARIREIAVLATPGRWRAETDWLLSGDPLIIGRHDAVVSNVDDSFDTVALTGHAGEHPSSAPTARHIALWDPELAELVAVLFDGCAAHWATRPIGDLAVYLMSPIAKLAKAILGGGEDQ